MAVSEIIIRSIDRLFFYGTTDSKGSYQCLTKLIKFNIDLAKKEININPKLA